MKTQIIIALFGLFVILSCSKDDGLFETPPLSDIEAIEGMEEAYEQAFRFNDSLEMCVINPGGCNDDLIAHYDTQFHQFDDLFEMHHNNYSHNNLDDDHHHEGEHMVRHGWMTGHSEEEGSGHNNDEDHEEFQHNLENMQMMMTLREAHEHVHPG